MSNNMTYSEKLFTPVFRASFPHLFQPFVFPTGRNYSQEEKPKYSVTMCFDKENTGIQWFRDEVSKLVKEVWPEGWPEGGRSPVKDGDAEPSKIMPGCWLVDCHSYTRPGIIDRNKEAIIDEERIYGGCFLRASITLAAYTGLGGGVTVFLNNCQFVKDGDRFGSKTNAADDFDVITDETPATSKPNIPAGDTYENSQLPF